MGDKIKVSATVIPKGIVTDGDKTCLQVLVALNPHLPDSKYPPPGAEIDGPYPDDWGLGYYREILHWYRYMDIFTQSITFRFSSFDKNWQVTRLPIDIPGTWIDHPDFGPDNIEIKIPAPQGLPDRQAAEELWKSMFTPKTTVTGWNLDELPYEIAARLSTQQLKDEITAILDTIISELLMPGHEDQSPADMALAHHLTRLRDSSFLIPLIFSDPLLSQSTDYRLEKYMNQINSFSDRYSNEVKQLHKELALHEQENLNTDNTTEFHKKFSGYSAHAYLLHKTGWLWAYEIDISDHVDEFIKFPRSDNDRNDNRVFVSISNDDSFNYRRPLYLKITDDNPNQNHALPPELIAFDDPFYFNFLEEVKFFYPLTAVRVLVDNDRLCKIFTGTKPADDAPDDLFLKLDSTFGYIRHGNVGISADIIDRQQMMDKFAAQQKANKANKGQGVQDGGQEAQSRDVDNAIRNEQSFYATNLKDGGGTEYTNNGITLSMHKLDQVISSTRTNTPAADTVLPDQGNVNLDIEGTGIIYLHNLLAGFRVDVAGFNKLDLAWGSDARLTVGSLCLKEEYFYTDSKTSKFCIHYPGLHRTLYEGWVGISAQNGKGNTVFIDQEVARWNNWSLVCMRLGDDQSYIVRPEDGSTALTTQVVPPERSMVPQRFGWTYSFALRPADICGNGPLPIAQQRDCAGQTLREKVRQFLSRENEGVAGFWTEPIVFQRVDSIPGPSIVRGTRLFDKDRKMATGRTHQDKVDEKKQTPGATTDAAKKWIEGREGEDTNNLVVRSFARGGQLVIDATNPETIRYLGPPPANLDLVVQHGALDNLLYHDPSAAWEERELNEVDEITEEIFQLADDKSEEYSFLYIDDNREIDYLYDPLADGLELSIDNGVHRVALDWGVFLPQNRLGMGHYRYLKQRYWRDTHDAKKNNTYYQLKLGAKPAAPDDGLLYLFQGIDNHHGSITLREGCELTVQVRCLAQSSYNAVDLFLPGVVKARSTNLKIIHAVERPCLIDAVYETGRRFEMLVRRETLHLKRSAGATDIAVSISFERFPALTSESYYLHIQYIDLIGDKTAPLGYRLVKTQKLVKSNIGPLDPSSEVNVDFTNMSHSFDTTIHRMANYKIEAVSRFKKYFTPHPTDITIGRFSIFGILRQDFADTDAIDDHTTLQDYNDFVAAKQWYVIPSTKRPDKPVIEKIVPLIDWKEEIGAGIKTVERRSRTVRIYLQDWHSSGANEKLAILFKRDTGGYSSARTLETHPDHSSSSLQGATTQFGLDPIVNEGGATPTPIATVDNSFFHGLANADFVDEIPLTDLQFPGAPDQLIGQTVTAALYDMKFFSIANLVSQQAELNGNGETPKEGKYYVDVAIDERYIDTHYFPFLRFPVARYQANSLLGAPGGDEMRGNSFIYRMSEIVLTDFVQLLPYRKLTIQGSKINFITKDVRFDDRRRNNLVTLLSETDSRVNGLYPTKDNLNVSNERVQIQRLPANEHYNNLEFTIDPAGIRAINIFEYEDYDHGALAPDEPIHAVLGDDPADLRNDFRKRMVFAYSHQLIP